jgi:hypothetical protein
MAAGVLFALTLPGLVILLVVVATAEHAWSRAGRRDDALDGAPPYGRIDLDGGVAWLDVPASSAR